jgi:hypothetical protein
MAKHTVEELARADQAVVAESIVKLQDNFCRVARERWLDARNDARRFQNLVYLLTAAAVALLLLALFLLIVERSVAQGIASGVGTVVTGAGAKFALDRRNEERQREIDRYNDYKADCEETPADQAEIAGDPRYSGGNTAASTGGGYGGGQTPPD